MNPPCLLAVCWMLLLALPGLAQETATTTWKSVAETLTRPWLEKKQINAVVIGVIDKEGQHHFLTLGEKPESLAKLDENTIFEIGSITKTMTAMLLADAIQRMELKLDDPVQEFMPEGIYLPARDGKPITLEHLATHTSGFPRLAPYQMTRLMFDQKLRDDPYRTFQIEDLKKALASIKIRTTSKPKVEYSNFGTGLLGYALTQKYRKNFETLLRERLFQPLGMNSSYLEVPESEQARFIEAYNAEGKVVRRWGFSDVTAGAGGVRSTAADMLRYLQAGLKQDHPLTPAFNLALAPQYEINASMKIGLNWLILQKNGKSIHWHNGGTGGFASYAALCRDADVAVVVLSNRAPEKPLMDELGMKLIETLIEK